MCDKRRDIGVTVTGGERADDRSENILLKISKSRLYVGLICTKITRVIIMS